MKHLLTGLAALTLVACGGNGTDAANSAAKIAEVGDGSSVCPASEVISDIAMYKNDHPAAQDDFAAWHTENGQRAGVVTTESGLQLSLIHI